MYGLRDDGTKVDDRYCLICGILVSDYYERSEDEIQLPILCDKHKQTTLDNILEEKTMWMMNNE